MNELIIKIKTAEGELEASYLEKDATEAVKNLHTLLTLFKGDISKVFNELVKLADEMDMA